MNQIIRDLDKRKLYRQVAREHNLFISEVEKIVESQFEFLAKTIAEGEMHAVRLPFFGLFHVRPGRKKYLDKQKEKKNA